MKIKECCDLVCKLILIMISIMIVLMFLSVNTSHPDSRIMMLGFLHRSKQKLPLKRFIELPQSLAHFQLIEINDANPKVFGDEAFLIINLKQQKITELNLWQSLQKAQQNQVKIPTYTLHNKHKFMMNNEKEISQYLHEIDRVLRYFSQIVQTKKLTLLVMEESALLMFKALASMSQSLLSSINKVIMINLYHPDVKVYYDDASFFIEDTKAIIIKNTSQINNLNKLRIISIRTKQSSYPPYLDHQPFQLEFKGKILAQSITIPTRFMWNVYSQLKSNQYLKFEPFLELLSEFIVEDRKNRLSRKQILYFFMYRQTITLTYLADRKKNKLLNNCAKYVLSPIYNSPQQINETCTKLATNSKSHLIDQWVILTSNGSFDVYGQDLEKIQPFQSKLLTIYILSNLNNYEFIYVIKSQQTKVTITLTREFQPFNNPLPLLQYYQSSAKLISMTFILKVCPDYRLVFPDHFRSFTNIYKHLIMVNLPSPQPCYLDSDDYQFYWSDFIKNWQLQRNLAIFTLLCTHITSTSTFSRMYKQLLVNLSLSFVIGQKIIVVENLVVITIVILVEVLTYLLIRIISYLKFSMNHSQFILIVPILIEISSFDRPHNHFSRWKILNLSLLVSLNDKNAYILFIHLYFLLDHINFGVMNYEGYILAISWSFLSYYQPVIQAHKLMVSTVNTIYLAITALCINGRGTTIRHIINYFIITHILLTLHRMFLNNKIQIS